LSQICDSGRAFKVRGFFDRFGGGVNKKGPKESGKIKENIKGRVFSVKYFNLVNFATFV
jgi:hypothetical protein